MTTLEKLKDVKALLDGVNGVSKTVGLNSAANTIRQIGETIVSYYLKEKGLWREACTDKDKIIHTEENYHPNYGWMVTVASNKNVFSTDEIKRFRNIQNYGNSGSHLGRSVFNEFDVKGLAQWLEEEFFVDHPEAARLDDEKRSAPPTVVVRKPSGDRGSGQKDPDMPKKEPLLTASFLEAELAKELLKTQEDYDAED